MQTDTQKHNETVTPNSKEIGILKKYFPQCFSVENTVNDSFDKKDCHTDSILLTQNQGKESFDIEKFKELIAQNDIEIKKEGFTLNFLGKSYARYQANFAAFAPFIRRANKVYLHRPALQHGQRRFCL